MRWFNFAPALFSALVLWHNSQVGCSAHDSLEQGERLYSEGKYSQAESFFESSVRSSPQDATAHYFLANVLLKLNKPADAVREYSTVLRLRPTGQLSEFSHQALSRLESENTPMRSSAQNETGGSPEPNGRAELQDSVKKIGQETTIAKSEAALERVAKVNQINAEAESRVKALEDELSQYLYANRYRYIPRQVYYVPDNEPVKADYAARIEAIKKEARKRVDEVELFYKQRELAQEDTALRLDSAYANGQAGGTVRLNPRGTSTFIRNYETEQAPSGDPVPVIASPKSLNSKPRSK